MFFLKSSTCLCSLAPLKCRRLCNTMPSQALCAGDAKQENDPVARMGGDSSWNRWTLFQYGVEEPPIWASKLGWEREAISYAAIIYSSLGMEEEEKEAFTAGVINIFGSQLRWALLSSCHPLSAPSSHWNQRFAETRPKPAYGRQGLDWIVGPGYSFVVFSTNKTMETNQKTRKTMKPP